ncbi:MAG: SLC13 family permease [Reyranellaceae bacterium]
MTTQQIELFALFGVVLAFLLWGRFRYDLVAACGLLAAVALGLVPPDQAFSGFSNPAVIVVALVLVASRAFENSGALGLVTRGLIDDKRGVAAHITIMGGIAAGLSMVINNVAALALLMPLDIKAARAAGRVPAQTLMPLAFATILGGMVTLIGTPPNIIASSVRAERLGQPYQMFDFAPVGLGIALAGIAFVALAGWRLIPRRADPVPAGGALSFKAELVVPAQSPAIGRAVAELADAAERADVLILGLLREGIIHRGKAARMVLIEGDVLLVEGTTDAIGEFIKTVGLQDKPEEKADEKDAAPAEQKDAAGNAEKDKDKGKDGEGERPWEPTIVQAVVRTDSRIVGRSAVDLELRSRMGVTLLGIARAGDFMESAVRRRSIAAGDLLLLTGIGATRSANLEQLGLIAMGEVNVAPARPLRVAIAVGLFAAAIAAAAIGLLPFTVAIAIAVAGYAATGLVPAREFYSQIEWPVVVMLACLLPIGAAFERLGGTTLMAGVIVDLTRGQPATVALIVLMLVTMTLSDVLNNVATMVIAGPLALDLAARLSVNPDTFLMGAAIATSCAFLTPIGHKNNTLIMGPGGYRFADYWRMGLPLELVVLAVGVPLLLIVWPL